MILLGIPSHPVEFFGLRDIIIVFTSASETGIVFVCTILSGLIFLNNDEALYLSLCLVLKFVTTCVQNLLNAFAMSLVLFNYLSQQFILVIMSYD